MGVTCHLRWSSDTNKFTWEIPGIHHRSINNILTRGICINLIGNGRGVRGIYELL